MLATTISFVQDYLFTMPALAKFAVGMAMPVIIPRLGPGIDGLFPPSLFKLRWQ